MTRPALLLIDLINPFDFASGEALFRRALPAARATGERKARARAIGVPAIYVNEIFDGGATELRDLLGRRRRAGGRGLELLDALAIDPERDHFVAKPKHSGFYCTDLDALLQLEVCHLILTGVAADICVLPMPQCGPAL